MKLGTILPDLKKMQKADTFADAKAKKHDAEMKKNFPHCTRRVVGGEVRYYDTTDQYAIMTRSGAVIWFQTTADGDFRIK